MEDFALQAMANFYSWKTLAEVPGEGYLPALPPVEDPGCQKQHRHHKRQLRPWPRTVVRAHKPIHHPSRKSRKPHPGQAPHTGI